MTYYEHLQRFKQIEDQQRLDNTLITDEFNKLWTHLDNKESPVHIVTCNKLRQETHKMIQHQGNQIDTNTKQLKKLWQQITELRQKQWNSKNSKNPSDNYNNGS